MRYLLLVVLCLGTLPSLAQSSEPNVETKYWVFFGDKPVHAAKKAPISPRAIDRRSTRGSVRSDRLDAPVDERYLTALRARGLEPGVVSRWLNAVSMYMTEAKREEVSALPFVSSVRRVGSMTAPAVNQDPVVDVFGGQSVTPMRRLDYGLSAGQLAQISAIAPLEAGINGTGIRLGIIDTWPGDLDHPSLKHLTDSGRLRAFRNLTGNSAETHPHGRMVLSIAAGFDEGNLIGPAHGAEVYFAATEFAPTETNQEEDHWVEAIEWLEAEGVDVVNTSLGYSTFDPGQASYTYSDMDGDTAVTTRAADIAVGLGVVVVSSAGNEGCFDPGACWYYITAPADGDSVIAAGAATSAGLRASFSSFGPTSDGRIKPDLSARGQGVTVASGSTGYTSFGNGTSFSAPLISGVIAQVLQANPNLTPIEVRDLLRATASQSAAPDNELGWGIVNAEAAIALATLIREHPKRSDLQVDLWPNPMRSNGTLRVTLPANAADARLDLYDLTGRRVAAFDGGTGPWWTIRLDATSWPSGALIYRLTTAGAASSGLLFHVR